MSKEFAQELKKEGEGTYRVCRGTPQYLVPGFLSNGRNNTVRLVGAMSQPQAWHGIFAVLLSTYRQPYRTWLQVCVHRDAVLTVQCRYSNNILYLYHVSHSDFLAACFWNVAASWASQAAKLATIVPQWQIEKQPKLSRWISTLMGSNGWKCV